MVVAVLPLVALVWVRSAGRRLSVRRKLRPSTIPAGDQTEIELELEHRGLPVSDVLLAERHSPALGEPPHLTLRHLANGVTGPLHHPLTGTVRGVFHIGPLEARIGDPFGLARMTRQVGDVDQLVVTPRLERLTPIRFGGSWIGAGDNRPRSFAVGNAADVAVREYRTGDDLRRVHWPSTARTGDLMVRREEQPWQSRCTLLLDNRGAAHRGSRTDSTFELAIAAAGSVAVHLASRGFQVRFVTAGGDEVGPGWHDGEAALNMAVLLEELALFTRSDRAYLDGDWVDDTTRQSLLIGVFGVLHDHDAAFLKRLARLGSSSLALAIDPTPWRARGDDVPATARLVDCGWRAATVTDRARIPSAWQELSRR